MKIEENLLKIIIKKKYLGSTHRFISPNETIKRVNKYLPIMGITRVANITGLDRIGIPVIVACRPNSRSLSVSQGKGVDIDSAKASAIMESIESYHAERIISPLLIGSYEDLRYRYNLVDPVYLPKSTNSKFHPNLQLLWIEGFDIVTNMNIWVPFELVHTNYTITNITGSGCFNASSNGLASGNHTIEAIEHAICELIERDSTTLWYLKNEEEQSKTQIDLKSVSDSNCRSVIEKFEIAGIDVAVWDTSSDLKVPSFLAIICDKEEHEWSSMHAAAGMGCHPNRSIAMLRSLTEAAQSRLTVISGSRDDIFLDDYETSRSQLILENQRNAIRKKGNRSFKSCPNFDGKTFNDDVNWLINRLKLSEINEVIVLNLTLPEFNIPVVRVIIPKLEGLSSFPGYFQGERANKIYNNNNK